MATVSMTPAPGERLLRFVGDYVEFTLKVDQPSTIPAGWKAFLRTNIGNARLLWDEIICSHCKYSPLGGVSWHDYQMQLDRDRWRICLPLVEPGFFEAKAFAVDPRGFQHWPEGANIGISVHPNFCRTRNIIYCAFVRLFGSETLPFKKFQPEPKIALIGELDQAGFNVIPPSGKLRQLTKLLPHIFDTLGCKILHLLPINPTPTTFARFGRFGSPYAALDMTVVDPALVEFDRRTTGLDQFGELAYNVHCKGGLLFLDLAINHTGWGSRLQEEHPEWFLKDANNNFISPGAWGVTWEDLCELDHRHPQLWEHLAEVFLTWCKRGVDGFRCDAGYKIPLQAWRYIIARVRKEFPETIFLLEGLGGSWEATENLLTYGGMQWAYSELFQNYSGKDVAWYLDYALKQSSRLGLWVHYSETHDNNRLAASGKNWSILRNTLCALTSVCGGFGFTCGVEWLASEKINVHNRTGLNWGAEDNIIGNIRTLTNILSEHPSFYDGAELKRLSPAESPVYVLLRRSYNKQDIALVLVNCDPEHHNTFRISETEFNNLGSPSFDLLTQEHINFLRQNNTVLIELPPAGSLCLTSTAKPSGLHGEAYRTARAQYAWAIEVVTNVLGPLEPGHKSWTELASLTDTCPWAIVFAIEQLKRSRDKLNVDSVIHSAQQIIQNSINTEKPLAVCQSEYQHIVFLGLSDFDKVTPVPENAWIFIINQYPFACELRIQTINRVIRKRSTPFRYGYFLAIPPIESNDNWIKKGVLQITQFIDAQSREISDKHQQRHSHLTPFDKLCLFSDISNRVKAISSEKQVQLHLLFSTHYQANIQKQKPILPDLPILKRGEFNDVHFVSHCKLNILGKKLSLQNELVSVLLTNRRGGMARIHLDPGRIESKYDCLLGANLNPNFPEDRHIFVTRARLWINADGFLTPLDLKNLAEFSIHPYPTWRFIASAGSGKTVELFYSVTMLEGKNTVIAKFSRPIQHSADSWGIELSDSAEVRITVRLDIEDRNFHTETHRNPGTDFHFDSHTQELQDKAGFRFKPSESRELVSWVTSGIFHHQPEWSHLEYPVEATRGMTNHGDCYSPGWFEVPIKKGDTVYLIISTESDISHSNIKITNLDHQEKQSQASIFEETDYFGLGLLSAMEHFLVKRGSKTSVIAGYPWFLDWGRDALIFVRGLVSANKFEDAKSVLELFAEFFRDGTLPNCLFGDHEGNRDTVDAPLWFGVACHDLMQALAGTSGHKAYRELMNQKIHPKGYTFKDILVQIAQNFIKGTFNGIRVDKASGLVWSPAHFTWMDTNYPACTPREGYAVEIQALWFHLLDILAGLSDEPEIRVWKDLSEFGKTNFLKYFWLSDKGYLADVLLCKSGVSAIHAVPDDALRPNSLFPIIFGVVKNQMARQTVAIVQKYLVVPGAVRSLAPLPVNQELPIYSADGCCLNNPREPYFGKYQGPEDTQRKPAYHNGTAWTWLMPVFAEALARAWDYHPEAVKTAMSYLKTMEHLLVDGCLEQIPEIIDGDIPHQHRGCDAQAWSVSEALRVWRLLKTCQRG